MKFFAVLLCLKFTIGLQGFAQVPPDIASLEAGTCELFVRALTDDAYKIGFCQALPQARKPEHYIMQDGSSLLLSSYRDEDKRAWRAVVKIVESVKGDFDKLAVYREYYTLGRIWPAFHSSSFLPRENSRWIVIFEEKQDGDIIEFKYTEQKLPVLELASREFGIIRYDEPNHLNINAEDFLLDLKLIVQYMDGHEKLSSDQLKTNLGKMIFDRVPATKASK